MIREKLDQETMKHLKDHSSNSKNPPRVLLLEDNDEMRALLAEKLRKEGYEVFSQDDHQLLCLLDYLRQRQRNYDLVISDIEMPFLTRIEVLEIMHEWDDFPPLILISAFGDENTHVLGAFAVLGKPFKIEDLLARVREILAPQTRNPTPSEEESS